MRVVCENLDVQKDVLLQESVEKCTDGKLTLAMSPEVGRCLEVKISLKRGDTITDRTLYVGRSSGEALVRCCGERAPRAIEDLRLVAEMDIVAVVVEDLACAHQTNGCDSAAQPSASAALATHLAREALGIGASIVRQVHSLLREELACRLPLSELEEFWRSFPLNWRCMPSSLPGAILDGLFVVQASEMALDATHVQPALFGCRTAGLCLLQSLCEHSCRPSHGVHFGEDGSLRFVALRPVPVGSRISTSYLDLADLVLPTLERRARLREAWHFDCACARCIEELEASESPKQIVAPMNAIRIAFDGFQSGAKPDVLDFVVNRCCKAIEAAEQVALEIFGCVEQTAIELRFYKALISGSIAEASAVACDCSELLGEDSSHAVAARHLEHDGLAVVLRQLRVRAREAILRTNLFPVDADGCHQEDNSVRLTILQLCRDAVCARLRAIRLPCGRLYAPQLASRAVADVVERDMVAVSAGGYGAAPMPVGGGQGQRVSRFRAQRQHR